MSEDFKENKSSSMSHNIAQRLALNIDSHIVIDAGAGTGKTRTIIDRVIEHYLSADQRATRILPTPDRPSKLASGLISTEPKNRIDLENHKGLLPSEVVLLTFTTKAADEMRDRLRRKLVNLSLGSKHNDGENMSDPRILRAGLSEQFLYLLDDAPIGTIDSFFHQLIAPYKGILGNSLSHQQMTISERITLKDSALNTLWRLPSYPLSVAVDAGIYPEDVEKLISSRDRIQNYYSSRRRAMAVIRNLSEKSLFLDEATENLTEDGRSISPILLKEKLLESIDETSLDNFNQKIKDSIDNYCQYIKNNIVAYGGQWDANTRISCLDYLSQNLPDTDASEKLVWLSNVIHCTASRSSIIKTLNGKENDLTFFSGKKKTSLPDKDSWEKGIGNVAVLNTNLLPIVDNFRSLWGSKEAEVILHYTKIMMLMDSTQIPFSPPNWLPSVVDIGAVLPNQAPYNEKVVYRFSIEQEAEHLDDLRVVLCGFLKILSKLKQIDELHDFSDTRDLVRDLLLSRCPENCRSFYHQSIIDALDNANTATPWDDNHIHLAFDRLKQLELTPSLAGESFSHLQEIRRDIEYRFDLLRKIRRRYRAFVIDEAQDNSTLQWQILARLWGERHFNDNEINPPDTPWQPTICYVGDIKQSIYSFRQAEVGGFRLYSDYLRDINKHEFASIKLLTDSPPLRKENKSRDPRNANHLTISRASKHLERGGQDLDNWVDFQHYDEQEAPSPEEIKLRKEGVISLKINYRTDAGLLELMNEWWKDIFSPRHRKIPNANFYADTQLLSPNNNLSGSIEWICPVDTNISGDPPSDLNQYIDPFSISSSTSHERQALMIALRIKNLVEGKPIRVRASSQEIGENILPAEPKVPPSEIMVLLPTRNEIGNLLVGYLEDFGIAVQSDKEDDVLAHPAVHTLNGLIQFLARPFDRHHASWVARSCLIGFNDEQLDNFIRKSDSSENLLERLLHMTINDRQKSLVNRWIELSKRGRINQLLEDTIDNSDLFLTYSDRISANNIEQFLELIGSLSSEVGGDIMVIANHLREFSERASSSIEDTKITSDNSVKIMSIHKSKGLESSVVFLVNIFSRAQTTTNQDSRSRVMVSPELFAGNPKPWGDDDLFVPASWLHTKRLYQARTDAEARRLFYVGATRAKKKLILVGSPTGTTWKNNDSTTEESYLSVPWKYQTPIPQLGQMWLESLRQKSYRSGQEDSPWHNDSNFSSSGISDSPENLDFNFHLDPFSLQINSFIGNNILPGITLLHHPDCFNFGNLTPDILLTPLQKIERKHNAAKDTSNIKIQNNKLRKDSLSVVKIQPSRLSILSQCSRRHWIETRAGISSNPIISEMNSKKIFHLPGGIDAATFGNVIHRIVEIGIPNPGLIDSESPSLPDLWVKKSPNNLMNTIIHDEVYKEILPSSMDSSEISPLVCQMIQRLSAGKLGRLVSGEEIDGVKVEGLRTEMPFHISFDVSTSDLFMTRWTPNGEIPLSQIEKTSVVMDGLIDLVLCTISEDGPCIRPIDLKTEEATKLYSNNSNGLLESLGKESYEPSCISEYQILNHHRMQLVIYHRALQKMESKRKTPRKVLRPAIWIGVTGRLVEYPEEMFEEANIELDKILAQAAKISLDPRDVIENHPPLSVEESEPCLSCPFHREPFPVCGPMTQDL